MNVYDILYPPSTPYNGWVQIATLNKDKQIISLGYYDFEHLKEKVENLKINPKQDYYIMANTVNQYTKRTSDNLFSLNNIVIDCDIHSDISSYERDEMIEDFIWRLNRDFRNNYFFLSDKNFFVIWGCFVVCTKNSFV